MRAGYRACLILCKTIWSTFFRLEISGLENVPPEGQGVLLASNHQSYLDPVSIGIPLGREIDFVARQSLFRFRLFGQLLTYLNTLPIQRASADVGALRECIRRLELGQALVLFPEATRTRDGSIGKINPGFALIAKTAGVPIVPVFTDGAFQCWPRHRKLPRPGKISVTYGRPISPAEQEGLRPREIAVVLGKRIKKLQRDSTRRRGRIVPVYESPKPTTEPAVLRAP